MSVSHKIGNAAQAAAGKVKQGWGRVSGNRHTETSGRRKQVGADLKDTGEHLKDAGHNAKRSFEH